MRTLIISDVHFGDLRLHDLKYLYELLLTASYDRLVLAGDIVDLWLADWSDIVKSEFIKIIEIISDMREVVWVLGNHDSNIVENNIALLLPKVKVTEFFRMADDGKKFLILHGHQVYSHNDMSLLAKSIAKLNYFIWKYIGIDIQTISNNRNSYLKYVNRKRRKIIKYFGGNVDKIICGHTHLIGHLIYDEVELFDAGSMIRDGNYAIIENGKVTMGAING